VHVIEKDIFDSTGKPFRKESIFSDLFACALANPSFCIPIGSKLLSQNLSSVDAG